jgi:hypothetical protein
LLFFILLSLKKIKKKQPYEVNNSS